MRCALEGCPRYSTRWAEMPPTKDEASIRMPLCTTCSMSAEQLGWKVHALKGKDPAPSEEDETGPDFDFE